METVLVVSECEVGVVDECVVVVVVVVVDGDVDHLKLGELLSLRLWALWPPFCS